jgi:DNA-binding response OmpR family regulator
MMPEMNGKSFLSIRKSNIYQSIPFIMVNMEERNTATKNGVNDFIMKPQVKELVYKIRNVISLKLSIEKMNPDPFSKVTIKLSEKNFVIAQYNIIS